MTTNIYLKEQAIKLKFKNFRGVKFIDELSKMKPMEQECGILGSKAHTEDNMHWTAWFKDGDKKYYFDSFGLDPTIEIVKYLGHPILISTFQIQHYNEDDCGEWCLFVLSRLNKGQNFKDIILDIIDDDTY